MARGHLTHRVNGVNRVAVETEKGNRQTRLLVEGRNGEQAILGLA